MNGILPCVHKGAIVLEIYDFEKNTDLLITIKSGDLVVLNSGGPPMTIGSVNRSEGTADCWYFNHVTGELYAPTIPLSILKKYQPD